MRYLALVCGCSSACVSGEGLSALKKRFVLTSMKEFSKAEDYLKTESGQQMKQGKEKEKAETAEAGTVRYLRIGERASAVKTFYKEDADKFALLRGIITAFIRIGSFPNGSGLDGR